jgi:hypothetical protein
VLGEFSEPKLLGSESSKVTYNHFIFDNLYSGKSLNLIDLLEHRCGVSIDHQENCFVLVSISDFIQDWLQFLAWWTGGEGEVNDHWFGSG